MADPKKTPPLARLAHDLALSALRAAGLSSADRGQGHPPRTRILNLESRWQNAVYFAQGLAYPLASLATRLQARIPGLSDLGAVLWIVVPVLVGWVGLLCKAGRGRLAALAIGWYAISMAPAWLMLSFSYVVDGPRLMYEGAVGAALLWASPLAISWARPHIRRAGIVASLALVVGIAWGSLQFIQARAALYKQMAVAVDAWCVAESAALR